MGMKKTDNDELVLESLMQDEVGSAVDKEGVICNN